MRTICIIFLSLMGLCLQAQTYNGAGGNNNARLTETLPLDKSLIECIYSYKIHDPERDEDRESFKILEIGNDFSKFSSYGMYRVDSIVKHKYPNGVTVKEYFNLDKIYKPSTEFLIKDLKSGSLKFYDRVFMDRYVYEEPIPDIKWELGSDTKEICGYNCNQASASFRGRNWTAWYSDQLPVNNGPWKFGNLPGLILKLEDNDHEHIFEAIGI